MGVVGDGILMPRGGNTSDGMADRVGARMADGEEEKEA